MAYRRAHPFENTWSIGRISLDGAKLRCPFSSSRVAGCQRGSRTPPPSFASAPSPPACPPTCREARRMSSASPPVAPPPLRSAGLMDTGFLPASLPRPGALGRTDGNRRSCARAEKCSALLHCAKESDCDACSAPPRGASGHARRMSSAPIRHKCSALLAAQDGSDMDCLLAPPRGR
jgi:hypothetical protein